MPNPERAKIPQPLEFTARRDDFLQVYDRFWALIKQRNISRSGILTRPSCIEYFTENWQPGMPRHTTIISSCVGSGRDFVPLINNTITHLVDVKYGEFSLTEENEPGMLIRTNGNLHEAVLMASIFQFIPGSMLKEAAGRGLPFTTQITFYREGSLSLDCKPRGRQRKGMFWLIEAQRKKNRLRLPGEKSIKITII